MKTLRELRKIEFLATFVGGSLGLITMFLYDALNALATVSGGVFASINFRFLVWSWQLILLPDLENSHLTFVPQRGVSITNQARWSAFSAFSRFSIKFLFFLFGLSAAIFVLRLHPLSFMIGTVNVIVAALIYSLFFRKAE